MYASIRHYRVNPEVSGEIVGEIIQDFASEIVENVEGLVAYYVVDAEDGSFATVTIYDSQEVLEECSELAARWMKRYLLKSIADAEDLNDFLLEVGPILEGPVYVRGALEDMTERSPQGVREEPLLSEEGQGPELLTPAEVSRILRMSKSWVYQRIEKGEIPSVRLGNNIKIERQDLQEYLKARHRLKSDNE